MREREGQRHLGRSLSHDGNISGYQAERGICARKIIIIKKASLYPNTPPFRAPPPTIATNFYQWFPNLFLAAIQYATQRKLLTKLN